MTPEEIVRQMLERMAPENIKWWINEIAETESGLRRVRWLRFQTRFARLAPVLLVILILILIFLSIRGCNELRTSVAPPIPSGVSCASTGEDKVYQFEHVYTWRGCRSSMDTAFRKAEAICASKAASCTGACGSKTCAPGVVVKDIGQDGGIVFCDTFIGFTCDCGCR